MGNWRVYVVCLYAAIGGFCFGYDTGVVSGVLTMKPFAQTMRGKEELNALEKGTITGLLLAGCFVGSLLAAPSAEMLSRKRTILLGCLVFILGAALQCGANGYAMMVTGRAVAGLGIGALSMIVPLYQSELAPKNIRGRLISLQQLMITAGLMVAFWVGAGTERIASDLSWRLPLGIQIIPAVILCLGVLFLPFSPRWLVSKGRHEEALDVLAKLHAHGNKEDAYVVSEYNDICQQVELERSVAVTSYLDLFKGTVRRRLVLGILVQVFQQFTGINSIMYYAPTIFKQAGIPENSATLIASGVQGVLNMLATIPAVLYLDRLGRRLTMITGALWMAVAMLLCGIVMAATGHVSYNSDSGANEIDMSGNKSASYFSIVMIYFFVAGFAYSWGPVGWVYPAEIYPLNIRAKGTSITTAANWLMNFVISEIVPIMLSTITWGTYIFFGCCCFVMAACVFLFFPETKGKSLEEMDAVFGGSVLAFRDIKKHANSTMPTLDASVEKQSFGDEEKH
ncbi:general substrate transporter [Radiomyces spectabilis]|uniref:general substrate transporter n=1 Tax=Radiomyces spectabilis TaxID=64574 RepID=UPI00221E45E9|nr:general substrate transporter [Radiomyces spectabilis]KAI8378022.1 general substrate transporter [Radiomyces spectabilis]